MSQHSPIPHPSRIHAEVTRLIHEHFDQAEARLEEVRKAHFTSVKPVFQRHMRNARDIPADLMVLPHSLGSLAMKPVRLVPSVRRKLDARKQDGKPMP